MKQSIWFSCTDCDQVFKEYVKTIGDEINCPICSSPCVPVRSMQSAWKDEQHVNHELKPDSILNPDPAIQEAADSYLATVNTYLGNLNQLIENMKIDGFEPSFTVNVEQGISLMSFGLKKNENTSQGIVFSFNCKTRFMFTDKHIRMHMYSK